MKKIKVGKTLKSQLSITYIIIIIFTIASCILFNSFFLTSFYQNRKKQTLKKTYEELASALQNGTSDEDIELLMTRLGRQYNLDILILDSNTNMLKATMGNYEFLKHQLLDSIFSKLLNDSKQPVIEANDDYEIRIVFDPFIKMEFIEMWGYIGNNDIFMIRSAIESMSTAARLSNIFLLSVGLIVSMIASGIIMLISKNITKPILELTEISKKMKNLQFDAKYDGDNRNELDLLGENINSLSETLESTISELRTANNELRRDVENKDRLDAQRQEFISNISHELKTPIALIQGYAEGLKEGMGDDPDTRDYYVDVIVDEAARMNEMVKKLLTLNEIESGRDNVSIERFCLFQMIDNLVKNMDIILKANDIDLIFNIPQDLFVWADEYRTEEIFRNYLSNAIHHCTVINDKKYIKINSEILDNRVKISIFNTGLPIPDESMTFIWDKFYKVDKARTREYGGSGVGLSIVKAAVDCMGAKCGALNKENGVEFWVELNIV